MLQVFGGQLADFRRVASTPAHVAPFLDALFEETGDCVLMAVGETGPYAKSAHDPLSQSLAAHNRRYETDVAELVTAWRSALTTSG